MPTYFRSDGWVKSAQGPAVPGSQVYVCTQPANTGFAPPTPLASIYSDSNGLVPIVQPILTDGFGHYDFYVLPGVYTVVVALGGTVQQVYPDQSVGLASSSNPATFQTNGVSNVEQLLLNLKSGANITVSADSNGGVTITGAAIPGSVLLETNGVANALQTTLNLRSSDSSLSLTSDGVGGVDMKVPNQTVGSIVLPSGFNIVNGNNFNGTQSNSRNLTLFVLLSAGATLQFPVSSFKLVFNANSSAGTGPMHIGEMKILTCARATKIPLSSTAVTISGSGTPSITIPAGNGQNNPYEITSDTISLALDNSHDYYFAIWWTDVLDNSLWGNSNCPSSPMPAFQVTGGNHTSDNPLPIISSWGTGFPGRFLARVIVP